MAKTPPSKTRWDAENRRKITVTLHLRNDADILAALEGKAMQTEIKRLLRIGLKHDTEQPQTD